MALQFSTTVRNAELDAVETAIGGTAVLKIWTGTPPADCSTADSGTLLVTITLPADWMAAASAGAKSKSGTWSASASGTGTAGYYRIYESTATTCHIQGVVSTSGAEINLDNTSINSGQTVTISTYTWNAPNA